MKENNKKDSMMQLPIMEQFYSLQGEGFHSGRPAVFIRVAGCDVGCVWCDVKESWEVEENQYKSITKIVDEVIDSKCDFAVITGGEPATYNLEFLTKALKDKKIEVAIETSGVYPLRGNFDWVCFSPKKFKAPHEDSYTVTDELKVVIYHKSDFEWAEMHASKLKNDAKLYLQPEWGKKEELLPLIIDYIKENSKWKLSLQTHNYLDIP